MRRLITKSETPSITALEYNELMDWEQHPEKASYYSDLIKQRVKHGPKGKEKRR